MILRNGIKSNIRAKGRTALFFALIAALTFSFVLSLGVLSFSERTIARCDEAYRTIGLVEFTGGEYPDENAADDAARAAYDDVNALFAELPEGALAWRQTRSDVVFADGFSNKSSASEYADYGVVVLTGFGEPVYRTVYDFIPIEDVPRKLFGYDGEFEVVQDQGYFGGANIYILTENGEEYPLDGYNCQYDENFELVGVAVQREDRDSIFYYSARVSQVLYAADYKTDRFVNLLAGNVDFTPERGKAYIAHGVFIPKNDLAGPHNGIMNFEIVPIKRYDGAPFAEYDGAEPEIFAETADKYAKLNNCLLLDSARDINDIYEFHQGFVYADRGDIPSPDDAGACVITPDIAYGLDLSPGDEIDLTLLTSDENSRYELEVSQAKAKLRVAGITNWSDDFSGRIWAVGDGFGSPLFGYRLGTLRLDNASAPEAAERIAALLPDGVRLTLFDQGYGDAVKPLESAINAAANVAIVSSVGTVAVLLIFAFLFVGRQSGSVRIMVSLGTPRPKIAAWLLSGAMLITAAAAALGAVAGHFALPPVYAAVTKMTSDAPLYSETALGIKKAAELSVSHSALPALAALLGMTLLSLLFCLAFMRRALKAGTFDRGSSRVRVPRGATSVSGRGSVRFAALSIKRDGARSLIVPAVAAVLTAAVVFLAGVFQGWQNDLDAAHGSMRVSGCAVSTNGRYYSGLIVSPDNVRSLLALENIDEVYVSKTFRYWLPDEMPSFGGSSFSMEQRDDWIAAQPNITAVNALAGAKEFYYSEPSVEWLDGWDESFLAGDGYEAFANAYMISFGRKAAAENAAADEEPLPAVIGDLFAEKHGIAPGDSFSVYFREDALFGGAEFPVTLRAVGVYKQLGGKAQIYVPLAWAVPPDAIFGEYDPAEHQQEQIYFRNYYVSETGDRLDYYFHKEITFSTCRFTFSSAGGLDEVRRELKDAGFSRVGKLGQIRMTILLNDGALIRMTETLGRYVSTGKVMTAVIAGLISACGFVISWLLINGRKQEFALMRGFGVRKRRIFASFFLEQAFLCCAGTLIGCLSLFIFGFIGWLQPVAAAAFAAFYLAGCAISVALIGRTKLMELLAAKE